MPSTSGRPSFWLVVSIVTGLPLALWIYKCLMLVVFQRKIIYMGYAPPGARREELARDVPQSHLHGIRCEEIQIASERSVSLSGIVVRSSHPGKGDPPVKTVIVYLQGNAGNPLHRIPIFQKLLKSNPSFAAPTMTELAIVAVAPRSFWKSTRRSPTESGILADYLHIMRYTQDRFPTSSIVIYGHSLGGAGAVCLLTRLYEAEFDSESRRDRRAAGQAQYHDPRYKNIKGLILENPFASIPHMVRALYPERWIPYHHLGPLAFDKWDAVAAIRQVGARHALRCDRARSHSVLKRLLPQMMVLLSEKDELVPKEMGTELFEAGVESRSAAGERADGSGAGVGRKVVIKDALHENAWEQRQWLTEMRRYITELSSR